ncbi:MAG: multidrug efflux MFS transporter [Mesorhizobium sp.]|nr:MAG: multidrug efflux MFS transporter [Mesorhizobium sp.]
MNRIIPLILAVALFMENMDSTVIATSLPAIAIDIHTSPIALKLALTAYLVSLAIFIPISGWMADRFGAKKVFRAAIAVFIAGSVACAFSNSLPAFVVSRFLQGMGGAMMTPVGRLVLVRATPKSELVAAMSWLTVPALVGPLVGPPLDFPGFVLSGLAASGIVFGLSVVSLPALPPIAGFITVAVGLVSGVLYLLHARRARNPLLALELFRNQVFRSSVLGGSLFRIGIGAVPFLLPLMFQIGFGLTPFQSGMITFVSAVGAIGMKFVTALLFRLAGFRRVLVWGSLIAAGSIAIYGLFTPATPYALMLAILLVGGFIRSMFFTGVNALSYAEVSTADTSKATPIVAVFQQLSIALGVALAGGILEVSTSIHGGPLTLGDFHIAFFIVAAVSAVASLTFMRLAPDAGNAVSGHGKLTTPKTLEAVGTAGK